MPGEEALWRYKRGAARGALGRADAARADLQCGDVARRAGLGSRPRATPSSPALALQRGDRRPRPASRAQAESLCQQGSDPPAWTTPEDLVRSAGGR